MQLSLPDPCSRQLFIALCRRYELEPCRSNERLSRDRYWWAAYRLNSLIVMSRRPCSTRRIIALSCSWSYTTI